MVKEVFVGFMFDKDKEEYLYKISKTVPLSVNQYQWGFISGYGKKVDMFSTLAVGTFPFGNKKLFFKKDQTESEYGKITYLPIINFYCIREIMVYRSLLKNLSKIIKENDKTVVFVYSMHLPFVKTMCKLKKKFGVRVDFCLILPDLTGKYGIMRSKFSLAGIKDRLEAKRKFKYSNYADSFVFLTEKTKELFNPKPYTVIEGFLPYTEFDYSNTRQPKTILYTGGLNSLFGIRLLVEAFQSIKDDDYELWICGTGDDKPFVEQKAKEDNRIKYFGFVPKSKVAELQTKCDVLINPRDNKGLYTEYSFPSKTMEYLLSGSKVVMYKLGGVGDEYYDYIYKIDGYGAEAIARAIVTACNDDTFYPEKSNAQIKWIKENKNSKAQTKKITELINKGCNK